MRDDNSGNLPARRYADDEVAVILRRAALRDARADLPSPHDPTLTDLMAAAAEVGLDPAEVRRAAAVVPPARTGVATTLLGAPDRRTYAAILDGVTLPEARHGLVRVAASHLGNSGAVTEDVPGRFTWQETHLGGRTTVGVVTRGGATEIEVRADRSGHYLGVWFLCLVGWATVSALAPISLPLLPAVLAFVAAPPLLARPFWIRADRRLRARLEDTVMAVARALDEGAPEG